MNGKPLISFFSFLKNCTLLVILASMAACATPTPLPTATSQPTLAPTSAELRLSPQDPGAISLAAECRLTVDGATALKKDLQTPDHLSSNEPYRKTSDFDPNQYFKVLTHLSMAPGYVLDYIYFSDSVGGKPLLYARKSESAPFQSYANFLQSYNEEVTDEASYGALGHAYDYLQKVIVDQTPESYLEHVSMGFFGDQFYMALNAQYNDARILCDASDLPGIYQEMKRFNTELPAEVKKSAEQIDFTPTVSMGTNTVTLRIVLFTKWGGFYESIYLLDKNDPSKILDQNHSRLVEYDCGIRF